MKDWLRQPCSCAAGEVWTPPPPSTLALKKKIYLTKSLKLSVKLHLNTHITYTTITKKYKNVNKISSSNSIYFLTEITNKQQN